MLLDGVGDGAEVEVHRVQDRLRLLIEVGVGLRKGKLLFADEFLGPGMALVGHLGEAAHVGEKNADLAPGADERELFSLE